MQGSAAMEDLKLWQYLSVAVGALFIGLSKGGVPGIGNLTLVLMVMALPARAAVGILLPILISADIIAVAVYRRHALWPFIARLAPWVLIGVVIGYAVFGRIDDSGIRILIGVILLGMTAIHFVRKATLARSGAGDRLAHHPAYRGIMGLIVGFSTMVANAAGPAASMYFIAAGLPKYAFIGTAAWFFFLVNCLKVPLMIDLGIITGDSFRFSAGFMPYAVAGAVIAPFIVRHINQKVFEGLIWTFIVVGGLKLVFF